MDRQTLTGFIAFALACAALAFLAGVFAAVFQLPPYPTVRAIVAEIAAQADKDPAEGDRHFLYRARSDDSGVRVANQDLMQPGVTLVTGMWNDDGSWGPEVRLLNSDGSVLHNWLIQPDVIWPDSPHKDWVGGTHNKPDNYVHGVALLPDGDIVFNIEYLGLVRMNACGEVQWKLPRRTHHSVFHDHDGNFWVSGLYWREQAIERYVHLNPPFVEETLMQVSPEGEILRDISILDALYNSGYQGTFVINRKKYDLTHMNDVEVLAPEMADAFPMFNAGDILVSLRNFNMVLVVDGVTEKVKWHFSHPLIHQHDPDFEPDGSIVIFDNNDDTTRDGQYWGSTRLLKVNPADKSYTNAYPPEGERVLYTQEGGKHQLLANGNRLITEANAGRVIEVTADGELVWDWIIESREGDYLPEVLEGSRYPTEAAAFAAKAVCALN